ncbi:hypothetical protein C6Q12_00135 [Burkholderia multivorans]|nr:hypothetical protein C6Q12_00135 [Burkholderia multivorans]
MGTSPDCAVLSCGTGASGDGGRRQRDGSIFSRSRENVFSHRARGARWREKPRRFWCGFERVLARRVAVGGNGGSADQRARCDRRCRACDAGGCAGGELRGPLWPDWRGFQRFSRVRSPLKGTAFRLAWRAGYSHPGWSAPSRRYSHSPFGCTAFRPGFFVRARWCSPFECTGFGVARGGIYPHRDRSIRVDASDAHRSDSQTFE